MYTLDNKSQSIKAVCRVLLELSILYRLQRASKLVGDPGNLSLAKISVSTTFSALNLFFTQVMQAHYLNVINQNQHCELLVFYYL